MPTGVPCRTVRLQLRLQCRPAGADSAPFPGALEPGAPEETLGASMLAFASKADIADLLAEVRF